MQTQYYNDKRKSLMARLNESKDARTTSTLFLRVQHLDRLFFRTCGNFKRRKP